MFIDSRQVDDGSEVECDICIAGAGAAGITLAVEFLGRKERVCLLESGGLEFDEATQALYQGEDVGSPYGPLEASRLRYFGGTTNQWAGHCVPFSPHDFARKEWIPDSGWPIAFADVAPYYERAHALLRLPKTGWVADNPGWNVAAWEAYFGYPRLPLDPDPFGHRAGTINPLRMGEVYRDALAAAANVRAYLRANLVSIDLAPHGRTVDRFRIRTLSNGTFAVSARHFVLAAGGIENPRLLLASDAIHKHGIGNDNDLVGRFFADRVSVAGGAWFPADRWTNVELYQRRPLENAKALCRYVLTWQQREAHKLVPAWLDLVKQPALSAGTESLRQVVRGIRGGGLPGNMGFHLRQIGRDIGPVLYDEAVRRWHRRRPVERVDLRIALDPAANKDSRVMLGDKTDAFGTPRAVLDWRLSEIDFRTLQWFTEAFASAVAASGLGYCRLAKTPVAELLQPIRHHMCTTRMADDPKSGVVDRDCRVFGVDNLFIAGSSVFSEAGGGSPTMFIVVLAQRLADTLKEQLRA